MYVFICPRQKSLLLLPRFFVLPSCPPPVLVIILNPPFYLANPFLFPALSIVVFDVRVLRYHRFNFLSDRAMCLCRE